MQVVCVDISVCEAYISEDEFGGWGEGVGEEGLGNKSNICSILDQALSLYMFCMNIYNPS